MNRLLYKWLPETIAMNLNKIFFLEEIIQLLIWYFPVYKGISWHRDSILFKLLGSTKIINQNISLDC